MGKVLAERCTNMRKPIIAGNWKMNKTLSEAKSFVEEVKNAVPAKEKVDSVICAPALFLESLVDIAKGTDVKNWCTKHAL